MVTVVMLTAVVAPLETVWLVHLLRPLLLLPVARARNPPLMQRPTVTSHSLLLQQVRYLPARTPSHADCLTAAQVRAPTGLRHLRKWRTREGAARAGVRIATGDLMVIIFAAAVMLSLGLAAITALPRHHHRHHRARLITRIAILLIAPARITRVMKAPRRLRRRTAALAAQLAAAAAAALRGRRIHQVARMTMMSLLDLLTRPCTNVHAGLLLCESMVVQAEMRRHHHHHQQRRPALRLGQQLLLALQLDELMRSSSSSQSHVVRTTLHSSKCNARRMLHSACARMRCKGKPRTTSRLPGSTPRCDISLTC